MYALENFQGMPDIGKIIACIQAAAAEFPDAKAKIEKLISDFKAKNVIAVIMDIASLSGNAKAIFNRCKESFKVDNFSNEELKLENFQGMPDIGKIIECLQEAVAEIPDVKAKIEKIIADFKTGNVFAVLMDIASLKGNALAIFNKCKDSFKAEQEIMEATNVKGMPDIGKIIACLQAAASEFPDAKSKIEKLISDFKAKNVIAVIMDIASLSGNAKNIFSRCKESFKMEKREEEVRLQGLRGIPDIGKMIQCLMAAAEQFPDAKAKIVQLIADFKAKNIIAVIKDIASLSGNAKNIFNQCK
jgi:hypothetical protein